MSVSACVCVFVREHTFGTTLTIFTNFCAFYPWPVWPLCNMAMAVARSSSGGVVIHYEFLATDHVTFAIS